MQCAVCRRVRHHDEAKTRVHREKLAMAIAAFKQQLQLATATLSQKKLQRCRYSIVAAGKVRNHDVVQEALAVPAVRRL